MTRSLSPWPVPPPRTPVADVRDLPRPDVPSVPAPRAAEPAAPAPVVRRSTGTAVLVTGSGGPAGVAVVRRLVALGHRVVAVDIDPIAAGSALAAVGGVVPRADDPGFVDALVAVAAEHGADALVSTVAEGLRALTAVGLTGPANVQGFVAEDGTVTVVEINPRFSGGLPLTLAAGADVVGTYLAGVREPAAELPYLFFTPGVRMSRYFAETYTAPDGSPVIDPCAAPAVTR